MRSINALAFPESFIQIPQYLSSCRLFFDSISSPPTPHIGRKEDFNLFAGLPNGVHLSGDNIFDRLTDLATSQKKLRDIGFLDPVIPLRDSVFSSNTNDIARLNDFINKNSVFRKKLSAAHDEAGLWIDTAPGLTRNDPNLISLNKAFEYGYKSLDRINLARHNDLCIAAGSLQQHDALKLIQAISSSGKHIGKTYPLITEFMKISVPQLTAKSYEDLLEIEEKLSEYLIAFKVEMRRLHAQIPDTGSLSDSMNHIYSIVNREINPKISELRRFLDLDWIRFQKHLLKAPSRSTLIGCITAYISHDAFLSAFPMLSAILLPTTHFIGALLDARNEKIEAQYDNPMTFAVLSQ